MSSKVAILTQPLGHNYGGIMQNFALQHVLKEMGHIPVNLDIRRNSPILRRYVAALYHSIKEKHIHRVPSEQDYEAVYRHTNAFVQKYISKSEPLYSSKDLQVYYERNHFNAFIVGSDQVWRESYVPRIEDYFLGFVGSDDPAKKISYAASFGEDYIPIAQTRQQACVKLLQRFDAVSVREDSAVNLLKNRFGVEASWVLDPTMLLSRQNYVDLLQLDEKPDDRIFVYVLDRTLNKMSIVESVAEKLGVSFYEGLPQKKITDLCNDISECIMPPVESWLESILNARYVVTDSFHGAVFSIIFKKPFICLGNKIRGNARFDSLRKIYPELEVVEEKEHFMERLTTKWTLNDCDFIVQKKEDAIRFLENGLRSIQIR